MATITDQRNQQQEQVRLWKEPFIWITISLFGFILVGGTVILVTVRREWGWKPSRNRRLVSVDATHAWNYHWAGNDLARHRAFMVWRERKYGDAGKIKRYGGEVGYGAEQSLSLAGR